VQEGMPIEEIASEVEEKWQLNGFTEII